jgi:hypothetical protein
MLEEEKGTALTYRELMEFVSWNFQCSRLGKDSVLECRRHGEIARWDWPLRDGELALMRAIGEHMDATGCGVRDASE